MLQSALCVSASSAPPPAARAIAESREVGRCRWERATHLSQASKLMEVELVPTISSCTQSTNGMSTTAERQVARAKGVRARSLTHGLDTEHDATDETESHGESWSDDGFRSSSSRIG